MQRITVGVFYLSELFVCGFIFMEERKSLVDCFGFRFRFSFDAVHQNYTCHCYKFLYFLKF